jgi:hypothetical protein
MHAHVFQNLITVLRTCGLVPNEEHVSYLNHGVFGVNEWYRLEGRVDSSSRNIHNNQTDGVGYGGLDLAEFLLPAERAVVACTLPSPP